MSLPQWTLQRGAVIINIQSRCLSPFRLLWQIATERVVCKQQELVLEFTVLETGGLRAECQHHEVPVGTPFQEAGCQLLAVPSHGRNWAGMPSGVSSIRAPVPFTRTLCSWHNHLSNLPPPNTTALGSGETNIQSQVTCVPVQGSPTALLAMFMQIKGPALSVPSGTSEQCLGEWRTSYLRVVP